MNRSSLKTLGRRWRLAAWLTVLGSATPLVNGAENRPAGTNTPPVTLDALVAEVLQHNPEVNFYRAEMAAARGERLSKRSKRYSTRGPKRSKRASSWNF